MCRHDFNRNNYETRGDLHFKDYELNSLPKTWTKVKAAEGAYTMLCFDDICRMIQKYPDIYIVTDTKYTDSEAVEAQFRYMVEHAGQADSDGDGSGILSHLIVQIYNRPMFQKIMDIYPFSSVIYTLYQSEDTDDQVVDFIKESGIRVVTTPAENFRADLAQRLNELGCKVYVHTIDDEGQKDEFLAGHVDGIYTNTLYDPGWISQDKASELKAEYDEIISSRKKESVSEPQSLDIESPEYVSKRLQAFWGDAMDGTDRWIIALTASGNISDIMTEQTLESFRKLGIKMSTGKDGQFFAGFIDAGELKKQASDTDTVRVKYDCEDGEFELVNSGGDVTLSSYGNELYSYHAENTLTVSIYDKMLNKIIVSSEFID
jgi:glycerophosphoryl diester phosphodiesterase